MVESSLQVTRLWSPTVPVRMARLRNGLDSTAKEGESSGVSVQDSGNVATKGYEGLIYTRPITVTVLVSCSGVAQLLHMIEEFREGEMTIDRREKRRHTILQG